jgi:hypothetical protein
VLIGLAVLPRSALSILADTVQCGGVGDHWGDHRGKGLRRLAAGAPVQIPQNRHGNDFVIPLVAVQRYLAFEGC